MYFQDQEESDVPFHSADVKITGRRPITGKVYRKRLYPDLSDPDLRMENASPSIPRMQESLNEEDSFDATSSSIKDDDDRYESQNQSSLPKESGSSTWIYIFTILVAFLAIFGFFYKPTDSKDLEVKNSCPDFLKLKDKYPEQDPYIWKLLKFGTEGAFKKKNPQSTCFMFAADNEKTLNKIISSVLEITSDCYNSSSKPIVFTASDLSTSSYIEDNSKVVYDMKPRLESSGILLVKDFNRVSTKVVPAFHSICDTYNPLVRRAVVLFTMIVPDVSTDGKILYF